MRAGVMLAVVAVFAFVDSGVSREAGAAVLCQKKSGAILVRPDACKKKEMPFDLAPFVDSVLPQRLLHDTVVVTESGTTAADTNDVEHTVACPAGYQATGGGVAGEFNQIAVDASGPTVGGQPTNAISVGTATGADGWFARVYSFGADAEPFKVSVICAKPAP